MHEDFYGVASDMGRARTWSYSCICIWAADALSRHDDLDGSMQVRVWWRVLRSHAKDTVHSLDTVHMHRQKL